MKSWFADDRVYLAEGSTTGVIDDARAGELVDDLLDQIGPVQRVLLVPPDYTRFHSGAGPLTSMLYRRLSASAEVAVMPALGTHDPMPAHQRERMFADIPARAFLDHRWREDLIPLGTIDADFVAKVSEGVVRYEIPIEVNRALALGSWDRIISVGQLVPHEVIGIANHVKNVLIGVGGRQTIHRSHYLGAVFGMERIMGQTDTPVRAVLEEGMRRFGGSLPITYLLTVRGEEAGTRVTRGLYAGDGVTCYRQGAALAREVNIITLDRAPKKVVVWLDPEEYHSTWLGNKAVYRTRMAIADGGELIVLAPGLKTFGEDPEIDRLIRAYGYRGTPATVEAVNRHEELRENLAAAAHLIHGSSEGRFTITYATDANLAGAIRGVGFEHRPIEEALADYPPERLKDGWNVGNGEEFYFIRHPGQGLWVHGAGRDQS